jgi:hypothetical protein
VDHPESPEEREILEPQEHLDNLARLASRGQKDIQVHQEHLGNPGQKDTLEYLGRMACVDTQVPRARPASPVNMDILE